LISSSSLRTYSSGFSNISSLAYGGTSSDGISFSITNYSASYYTTICYSFGISSTIVYISGLVNDFFKAYNFY